MGAQGEEGQEPQEEGCRQEARWREEGQEPQEEGRRQEARWGEEGQDPQEGCRQEARRCQEACGQEARSQEAGEEDLAQEEGCPQEEVNALRLKGKSHGYSYLLRLKSALFRAITFIPKEIHPISKFNT